MDMTDGAGLSLSKNKKLVQKAVFYPNFPGKTPLF